jgi:hypothetical protein
MVEVIAGVVITILCLQFAAVIWAVKKLWDLEHNSLRWLSECQSELSDDVRDLKRKERDKKCGCS